LRFVAIELQPSTTTRQKDTARTGFGASKISVRT